MTKYYLNNFNKNELQKYPSVAHLILY